MSVALLGAELDAEMEHQTARDTTTGSQNPMGERGPRMADTVRAAAAAHSLGGGPQPRFEGPDAKWPQTDSLRPTGKI